MDNIQLHYIEKGNGYPLILLHGNGEDCTYFKNQIDCFSKQYRVIAIDTRGHGKSPRGTSPLCLEQFAEDLKTFMDKHTIEKANILGFSDGGNTAIIFALKYSEKVAKLILNGANINPVGVKSSVQIPIIIGYKIAYMFSKMSKKAKQNAEILGLMVNEPNIKPSELSAITAKTLVIAGTKDMIKKNHTLTIAENIPNSELVFVKGNHFIAASNPIDFNRAVKKFLEN